MKPFATPETRETYFAILHDWDDPVQQAREWQDMCGPSARQQLARQLKKDFYATLHEMTEFEDTVIGRFYRRGLRKVCWDQIAERLLERYTEEGRAREQVKRQAWEDAKRQAEEDLDDDDNPGQACT
jgi:hypothetical protein